MGRRPVFSPPTPSAPLTDLERRQQAFQDDVARRKPRDHTFNAKKLATRLRDVERMRQSGDWEKATAQHFVALYVMRHEEVYGIKPIEMTDEERTKAVMMAHRLLSSQFGGDPIEMAIFMRDTWQREEKTEAWRRENNREGSRITWYRQFNGSIVTDWRLNRVRKGQG